MPAPFMLVTFYDADGDEFPIRVEGMWTTSQRERLIETARQRLMDMDEKDANPTLPLERVTTQLMGGV